MSNFHWQFSKSRSHMRVRIELFAELNPVEFFWQWKTADEFAGFIIRLLSCKANAKQLV